MGHYANDCTEKKEGAPAKPNPFQKAHVNHMNVEEATDTVMSKFNLNSLPTFVLFDSGASHSFISGAYVDKHKLPTQALSTPIRVSSLGAEMLANVGCHQMTLGLGKHKFPTDLIVPRNQVIDVILGIDWMTKHQGVIDCARRSIKLTTPEGAKIKFFSDRKLKGVKLNSLKGVRIEDVWIV